MSNSLPYMPIWVKELLGDQRVDCMTAEELGAYFRLLLMSWQEDPAASLPPDEGLLARWARLDTARWTACRERILACFKQGRDGRLYQKRLREVYEDALKAVQKKSRAGKKGAAGRWQKDPGGCDGNANALQTHCDGNDNAHLNLNVSSSEGGEEDSARDRARDGPAKGQPWPPFLAAEWCFYYTGTAPSQRDLSALGRFFGDVLKRFDARTVLAGIRDARVNGPRPGNQATWDFEKWLAKRPKIFTPEEKEAKRRAEDEALFRRRREEEELAKRPVTGPTCREMVAAMHAKQGQVG